MPRAAKNPITGLTEKQEAFCLAMFETGNGSLAYTMAYKAENMTPMSVRSEACRLLNNPRITQRLEALRLAAQGTAVVTRDQYLAALDRLKVMALASGNILAAIRAEELRGRVLGFYVEKIEKGKPGAFVAEEEEALRKRIRERSVKLGLAKVVPIGENKAKTT